jgi:hypothetical protein
MAVRNPSPFETTAPPLRDRDLSPHPIAGKRPLLPLWQKLCDEPLTHSAILALARRYPHAGVGLVLGCNGVIGVDVDTIDSQQLQAITAVLPRSPVGRAERFHRLLSRQATVETASRA